MKVVEFEPVAIVLRRVRGSDVTYFGGKWVLVARGMVAAAGDTVWEVWENFFDNERAAERGITKLCEKWDEAMYQSEEACRRMKRGAR